MNTAFLSYSKFLIRCTGSAPNVVTQMRSQVKYSQLQENIRLEFAFFFDKNPQVKCCEVLAPSASEIRIIACCEGGPSTSHLRGNHAFLRRHCHLLTRMLPQQKANKYVLDLTLLQRPFLRFLKARKLLMIGLYHITKHWHACDAGWTGYDTCIRGSGV